MCFQLLGIQIVSIVWNPDPIIKGDVKSPIDLSFSVY